jgi:hypothetical protein
VSDETTWRWSMTRVDPDDVYRSLRLAGALKAWDDGGRILYHLGPCKVECYEGDVAVLIINGPSEDAVRNSARRMLYPDTDGVATGIKTNAPQGKPEVAAK